MATATAIHIIPMPRAVTRPHTTAMATATQPMATRHTTMADPDTTSIAAITVVTTGVDTTARAMATIEGAIGVGGGTGVAVASTATAVGAGIAAMGCAESGVTMLGSTELELTRMGGRRASRSR